jgi:hypothetical protein
MRDPSLLRRRNWPRGVVALVVFAAIAIAAALASGPSGGGAPTAQAATLPLAHFACYGAAFTSSPPREVKLTNQFGATPAVVRTPRRLCAPAVKNGEPIKDRTSHLVCYAISGTIGPRPSGVVSVRNQFGTLRVTVLIDTPESLCLPSSKSLRGAPGPVPRTLDHYVCYPLRPPSGFQSIDAMVEDQFGKSRDSVVVPRTLCAPTSKNGGKIVQPRLHLLCYELKSRIRGRNAAVRNQFGTLRVAPAVRDRLCVPSLKTVIVLDPPSTSGRRPLRTATVEPQRSARFEPFLTPPNEARNEDPPRAVPTAPDRGPLAPSSDATTVTPAPRVSGGRSGDRSGASVQFFRNTSFQGKVAFSGSPPDMSGADSGQTAFATGNTFGALSTNGGGVFSSVNPSTIFPSGPSMDSNGVLLDKGLCCDQVIQYVPSIDRFIWLMQFCGSGSNCLQGRNRIRIASASAASVAAGATAWTYWDLTSGLFGLTGANQNMDYPDLAVGKSFLYMSVDNVGVGLLVARIPLAEIAASTTIHIGYTTPSDSATAYGGHLTQLVSDTGYWAGHVDNSTMRIFSVREGDNFYSWRDVKVNTWCNGSRVSTTPGGTNDWLAFGFPGNAVHGSVQRSNGRTTELWFSWTAGKRLANGRSCGFPQSHVEIVVLNKANFGVISQMQVWNPTIAFAYDVLATNAKGEVGMSLGYGGGGNEANHAVGFWGDFVVYSTTASTSSTNRFGDYLGIRRSSPNSDRLSAEGYGVVGGFDPHYVVFGR